MKNLNKIHKFGYKNGGVLLHNCIKKGSWMKQTGAKGGWD